MTTSWPTITESSDRRLGTFVVPGSTRRIRLRKGPTAALLLALASEYNREIARIDVGPVDDWGWAANAQTSRKSGHASGTAIDLNAVSEGRGWLGRLRMYLAVRRLKRKYKVVTCGGTSLKGGVYRSPRHWRWTHWAIHPNASEDQVVQVVNDLGIRPDGTFGTRPPVVPTGKRKTAVKVKLANLQPGMTNRDVKLYQTALRLFLHRHGIKPDTLNPQGPTGHYDLETRRMTSAAYGVLADNTHQKDWLDGDLSRPGDSLLTMLGLVDVDR